MSRLTPLDRKELGLILANTDVETAEAVADWAEDLMDKAWYDAHDEGRSEGYDEGREEGWQEGFDEGTEENEQ